MWRGGSHNHKFMLGMARFPLSLGFVIQCCRSLSSRGRLFLFAGLACAFSAVSVQAQVTRDFAIDLKADVSPTVPRITLSWTLRQAASITAQQVYRRLKGDVTWVSQATLTVTDTSWADPTAVAGVEYEYWMRRTYTGLSPNTAVGYITAGVDLPMVESRGKLLLVVDATMEAPLGPEIDQLKRDLTADGWTVQTISAARRDTLTDVTAAADTKALIKAAYDADPANVKQVYVLGHVPVPYAGNSAWDGHSNHSGAWSADGYYGDMDGTWTDSSVNNSVTANVRLTNVPGDGRLDQSTIPSTLELMVGRVDLVNMQRAPASNVTETALLRRYLRKAHDFKYKQGAYATTQRRVLIRDGFGIFGSEGFMRTGWAWSFTGVGRPPEVIFDEAPSGNWWTLAGTNNYLMANGNGGGSYETCGTVGATADFGRRPFRAAFMSLFGSYFGDWDVTNNFMRAPLAGNATGDGLGLCCFWAGRPSFFMHHMATGETLGYSMRASMNSQFTTFSSPVYEPVNFGGGGTHCGLLGDPSLRMHVVEPPRHFLATSAGGVVNLVWSASSEPGLLGYHVYRAATTAGPFTRLTASPLASPTYADATGTAGTAYAYMVRTLKLETSPGGTYQNLSQGEMATITVNAGAGAPLNPTNLAVVQNSSVNAQLSWLDHASDETGYRIERKVNATGSYSTLVTLAAGATGHLDAGPFANGNVYYYRVIATGAAGDSIPSNEVSFDAVAGFFEFNDTLAKVSKTIGSATFDVKRFGGVNGPVSVNYATSNTSALAGTHYTATSGTLNWADGETGVKTISVPITNTATAQTPRQFRVTLSTPSSGTGIGTYNGVSVLIEDPTSTLPAPWAQAIIGGVTDHSLAVEAEGGIASVTMGGSGLVTAATSDAGQFVYQSRTGDGVMTAYVPAANPVQSGARYAVMVRENATNSGAAMAATSTSSSTSEGTKMAYRSTTSGTAVFTGAVTADVAPRWLRITRAGNSFTSESSTDGVTWTSRGVASVPMGTTAQWGLFHHSDDRSGSTYSGNYQVIGFQNVTFGAISGPGAPGSFAFTQPMPLRVALTWTAGALAAGYRIERRTEQGTFAPIVELSSASLSFNDDQVAPDTGYEYRMYAFNASGNSPLTNVLRVTTPPADVMVHLTSEMSSNADASVKASGPTTNFGAETALPVAGNSSTGSVTAAAKTYFRFDVGALPTLKTATLRLTVKNAKNFDMVGFAYSASLRFFPDSADGWDESTINWNNAPLNNTATNGFLTGSTLVSTYTVSDASSVPKPGAIISLDASISQINANRGADGLITYGMNTTTPTASIEFASKEDPTLAPPTLEVTYASPLPKAPSFLAATPGAGSVIDLVWTDNSTTETGFEIQRRQPPGAFAPLLTTVPDATAHSDATGVQSGTFEYRVRANSATGDSAWSATASASIGGGTGTGGTEPLTYELWLQRNALPYGLAAAGDRDHDGLANLLEYALGSRADIADPSAIPVPGTVRTGDDEFLTLTFTRNPDVSDAVTQVEASASPAGPWTAINLLDPANVIEIRENVPDVGRQTLVVRDVVPVTQASRRFMRLRVTQP